MGAAIRGRDQFVEYGVEGRPLLVVEALAPGLLDLSPGCPDGRVECVATRGQLDDAGAAVGGIRMALDIPRRSSSLSMSLVACLDRRAVVAISLGRRPSTPAKRKSAIMAVVTSGCPAAWMRASISVFAEVVGETHPADDARYTLERCRS